MSLSGSPALSSSPLARTAPVHTLAATLSSVRPPCSQQTLHTHLYDFHKEHGARFTEFAGYTMPLSYGSVGPVASHHHVRQSVGLFDVSHMVQHKFRGPGATAFLEWLTPSSLSSLAPYSSTLSVILNEHGGIIDDIVITKHAHNAYYVVTNASRRDRDLAWIREKLAEWNTTSKDGAVEHELLTDWGHLALQGPEAEQYLQALTPFDLREITFGKSAFIPVEGFNLQVARGGYTGEDGFEISVHPEQLRDVAALLSKPPVQLTGFDARDSLRLEAGLCLYGSDLDENTTPVEAGLTWVIGKERRKNWTFIGADGVRAHLKNGPPRRRVGMLVEGIPARHGTKVYGGEEQIGEITSGILSPTLGKYIAMAYVRTGFHKKGTELQVEVCGRRAKAVVAPMPFVPTRYYRGQ